MAESVVQLKSADELSEVGWEDLLTPADYYLSQQWLRAVELSEDADPGYLLVERGGRAVCGLAMHRVDAGGSAFYRIDRRLAEHLKNTPRSVSVDADALGTLLPDIVCGGRHLGTTRLLFAPELSDADRREFAGLLLDRAELLAARSSARSVSFLSVDNADHLLTGLLHDRGYAEFPNGVQSVLYLPRGGFESYLAILSRRGRQTVRSDLRKVDPAGYRFEARRLTSELITALAPLEAALNAKYGGVTDLSSIAQNHARYLDLLPQGMSVLLASTPEGVVHGFVTFIEWRGRVLARNWGRHADVPEDVPLYFKTVYYELIEWCYSHGVDAIDFVTSADQVKRLRGCTQTGKSAFVRGLSAPVRRLVTESLAAVGSDQHPNLQRGVSE